MKHPINHHVLGTVDAMFQAISSCAALHPDPDTEDDQDGGDWYYTADDPQELNELQQVRYTCILQSISYRTDVVLCRRLWIIWTLSLKDRILWAILTIRAISARIIHHLMISLLMQMNKWKDKTPDSGIVIAHQ